MQNVLLIILLILALGLIAVVLLQRSEGGGLGIGGGGGGNMSGRPPPSPLARVTWALGAGFMAASLALTILANQGVESVTDLPGGETPARQAPANPLGGGSLLPPAPTDAPTQPPAAE
ncbi:MAG: preprotein translocase subunit SecG [Pseudomonadota bacterium]